MKSNYVYLSVLINLLLTPIHLRETKLKQPRLVSHKEESNINTPYYFITNPHTYSIEEENPDFKPNKWKDKSNYAIIMLP